MSTACQRGCIRPAASSAIISNLEFYVRKLAKNGVKLVSITQEMGDDPMHVMMCQIMALFDEYHSKENAKRALTPQPSDNT